MNKELETIEESAKAIQEVAKTTSNAIDASREMGGFISRFVSGSLEQGMGIVEDRLRYTRWERQQRLIQRSKEFMKEQGISEPNIPVPLKNAVPFLEYATLEEDDYLQDMWARLLVNGTSSSTSITLERSFIEVLSQLTHLEAEILQTIYSFPFNETKNTGLLTYKLPESAQIADRDDKERKKEPTQEVALALSNLTRIGCLRSPLMYGGGEVFSEINPTLFGSKFIEACTLKKI